MPPTDDSPSDNLVAVVHEVIDELYNFGNVKVVDDFFDPRYVCHTSIGDMNRDQFKDYVRACRKAVPDIHYRLGEIRQVGDVVEWKIRVMGTHKRDLLGIAASGRSIDFWTENRMRLVDGRPVEHWIGADVDAIIKSLANP